jgi:hypothetical protein
VSARGLREERLIKTDEIYLLSISRAGNDMIYHDLKRVASMTLGGKAASGGKGDSHMEKERICLRRIIVLP